ncbi:MAG TPA: hypothetical protein VM925_18545 [Labilithrix sp.]|nr:hypothetical protein [Labilithrix sp.]
MTSVREAAAEFIRGTTFGWGRHDLATWLVSQYAPCLVADVPQSADKEAAEADAVSSHSTASSQLDDDRIEQLILDARSTVLRMLSDLAWPSHAKEISQRAVASGAVIALRDAIGTPTWAPVARKRMRLAERVSSLFIADSLNTPHQYRNISLCRHCGELGFTAPIPHPSWCERAARVA